MLLPFAIHGQIHQARPDIIAAAHSHSMYGKTFSTLGKPLKMITQDATMFYNDVALCNDGRCAPWYSMQKSAVKWPRRSATTRR